MIYVNKEYKDLIAKVERKDGTDVCKMTLVKGWKMPGTFYANDYEAGHVWHLNEKELNERWMRKGNILNA